MLKKITIPIILGAIVLFILPVFYLIDYSQQISLTREQIHYDLPYPGILPDHPLYVFKTARDKVLEFFTRDNIKKAELYLLLSDKRVEMASELAKKGKNQLAISTFSKAEKYFLKIPPLLIASKEQGVSPNQDFVDRVKLANAKHREILNELVDELPQGEQDGLTEIQTLISKAYDQLNSLH